MNLDFTSDENFWSCFLGLYVHNLFRAGMDQTVVQRYLASRTLRDAQRIMVIGIALNVFYMIVIGLMALALIYWYRDCDPMLTGAIKKFDQILPYYVKQNLMDLPGFSGLFLTGVVSAAT
ncbi:putative sodium/solute symporter, partial [Ixodes scapularis]